jgi:hypothetical protein
MIRGILYFALGVFISLLFIVQLRGCGPTLGDQISSGICERTGGHWDSRSHTCMQEY